MKDKENIQYSDEDEEDDFDDSAQDDRLVDKDYLENINGYIKQTQIAVSNDGKYICVGTVQDKGMKSKDPSFEWKYGFKKCCFEDDIINVEGSCFSDYTYIEECITINFPTKADKINNFIQVVDSAVQKQSKDIKIQSVLAVGKQNSLVLYSLIDYENLAIIKKLLTFQDLKSEVNHIIWMNAYSLLLLLADYSLVYFQTSPTDIGFAVKP